MTGTAVVLDNHRSTSSAFVRSPTRLERRAKGHYGVPESEYLRLIG